MPPRTDANTNETISLDTPSGRLVGVRHGDVRIFRGVPYARPPVGPLRWRLPEPFPPWSGARDATRPGPVCPQSPTSYDAFLGGAFSAQSEDCLHLNVFAPSAASANRPVMVWIHGGAFIMGAGSQSIYDGSRLAARDVIVVTINYRLGAFGYLALADASEGAASGMGADGVADQIIALDWVRRNIAAFGGDPDNVTIFGESAGAMCVAALLASPAADGLHHKAILQSGAAHIGHDRDRAGRVARAFLNALSLSAQDAHLAVNMPAALLLKAQTAVLASAHDGKDQQKLGRLPFQPVIDGQLLMEKPIDALRRGAARNIPIMAGTTRDEWKLFSAADPRLRLMTVAGFEARVSHVGGEAKPALLRAYAEGSAFERYSAFMGDRTFAAPNERMLATQIAGAPAFAYRFDWRSRFLGGIFGSCHALDIGFVFGTHGDGIASAFFGKGPEAQQLAEDMMASWTAFASTGDPSTTRSGPWPRYSPDNRLTMIFGDGPPHLIMRPDEVRSEAWSAVPDSKIGF
jgi:para-nitrobenzyl esterase